MSYFSLRVKNSRMEVFASREVSSLSGKVIDRKIDMTFYGENDYSCMIFNFDSDRDLYNACKQLGIDHIHGMENLYSLKSSRCEKVE